MTKNRLSLRNVVAIAIAGAAFFALSCNNEKENPKEPVLTTAQVTAITANSAISGGNVTSDGGVEVTARGVCWATSANPTVSDAKTTDGTGTGSFTSTIAGLTAETTYYVRAYATNSAGTAYGDEVTFTTAEAVPDPVAPVLNTVEATNVTATSATAGGNFTNAGTPPYTIRGVCYATTDNPTVDDTKIAVEGMGTGSFTADLTDLTAETTYYVRAYAINSDGTVYGNMVSFTTLAQVQLLKTIIYKDGRYDKYEYDNQNRITKILLYNSDDILRYTYTLTYTGEDFVKVVYDDGNDNNSSTTEFTKNGNVVTKTFISNDNNYIEKIEVNNDGNPVKLESGEIVTTFEWIDGNIVKFSEWKDNIEIFCIEFKYDNMKSPFYNWKTPKWCLFFETEIMRFCQNNMIEGSLCGGDVIGIMTYEYDNAGFPTKILGNVSEDGILEFIYH